MSALPVRVMVLDTWDEFPFDVSPETTVTALKAEALSRARVRGAPEGYVLKYRGAAVDEGQQTVGGAGIVPNAALIVLSRRRVPAK